LNGTDVNLNSINDGNEYSGVPQGECLIAFAEAIVAEEPARIAQARQRLVEAMGEDAMIEAAAVASNFQRMVRIADATGIPLGEGLDSRSREVRADLNLDRFQHRKDTP